MSDPLRTDRAPIALFVYRRHELAPTLLDALQACDGFAESKVFVFSDGPKTLADAADVEKVRAIIRGRLTPNMVLLESESNKGLDPSILTGVSKLIDEFGRVIVIEDDLIVAPQLLNWFNTALEAYADDERVMQIAGHTFDAPSLANEETGTFMPYPTSWGWATWKRAWARFDPQATGWEALLTDRALAHRFNLAGAHNYVKLIRTHMRRPPAQQAWDIRWYWSVFKAGGLCLFPPRTLVLNVGVDDKATHGHLSRRLYNLFRSRPRLGTTLPKMPQRVEVDADHFNALRWAIRLRRY